MKLNLEGLGGVAGGCRMSPSPLPETVVTNYGGVGDATIYGSVGGTKFMKVIEEECNSSSSSSIGNNSDDDGEDREADDAQSSYRYDHSSSNSNSMSNGSLDDHSINNSNSMSNGSLDDAIQALEEALPIRRGISTFYNGKSKSFTCLSDMWPSSTPSIQDIAKPENAYTRKRRNLLASTLSSHNNKNRTFQLSNISNGRISKKTKISTLRFSSDIEDPELNKHATKPQLNRPSLLKKSNLSSLRSFSMVSLHQCNSRFGLNSTEIENC